MKLYHQIRTQILRTSSPLGLFRLAQQTRQQEYINSSLPCSPEHYMYAYSKPHAFHRWGLESRRCFGRGNIRGHLRIYHFRRDIDFGVIDLRALYVLYIIPVSALGRLTLVEWAMVGGCG